MSDRKWTPGPWPLKKHCRVGGHGTQMWWLVDGWLSLGAENDADAHLISAAPDLYEALEMALACHFNTDEVWVDDAREALKKARGEQ